MAHRRTKTIIWHTTLPYFGDLKFSLDEEIGGTRRARIYFPNGYGASVISGPYSYGGPGLYELAVLRNDQLCYDSGLTEDVEGHLTEGDVTDWLHRIFKLPTEPPSKPPESV